MSIMYSEDFFQKYFVGKKTKNTDDQDFLLYIYMKSENSNLSLEEGEFYFTKLEYGILEVLEKDNNADGYWFEAKYLPISDIKEIFSNLPLELLLEPIPSDFFLKEYYPNKEVSL